MKINIRKGYFNILLIIIFMLTGCVNKDPKLLKRNIYETLTDEAISLYTKRKNLLKRQEVDYYKCFNNIMYGRTFLDRIDLKKEIPCENSEWQSKIAYSKNIPIRIDFFSNGTYRQSIFLDKQMHIIGRYYDFNKMFSYYLIQNNYYDEFSCENNICTISRINKNEDSLLHPVSESYEANLIREKALKERQRKYIEKTKAFLEKYKLISKNIISESVKNKQVLVDKKNKTYITYKTINKITYKVICQLLEGKCSIYRKIE